MKTLSNASMLSRYPIRNGYITLEFQIGTRLIWVRCRPEMPENQCVALAEGLFGHAYDEIQKAILVAEDASRLQIPEFWAAHDASRIPGNRLDVWSLTLTPEDGSVSYYVSRNHEFDFDAPVFEPEDYLSENPISLPDVPDGHGIHVKRAQSGELLAEP